MRNDLQISGVTFNRLTAIHKIAGSDKWLCKCACGSEVAVRGASLTSGNTKSCGCLRRDRAAETKTKHGHQRGREVTPTLRTYADMIKRCSNPKCSSFARYGGRGITVCDRWLGEDGFNNFLSDMGERPNGTTIDRINNELGYFPENCRWATPREQSRNVSTNHPVTAFGRTMLLCDWAEELGIPYKTLHNRISTYRWDVERALTEPVRRWV